MLGELLSMYGKSSSLVLGNFLICGFPPISFFFLKKMSYLDVGFPGLINLPIFLLCFLSLCFLLEGFLKYDLCNVPV